MKAGKNLNRLDDSLKLADNILTEVLSVFDEQKIDQADLREKIQIYFKNRSATLGQTDDESESQNEVEGALNSGYPKRNSA